MNQQLSEHDQLEWLVAQGRHSGESSQEAVINQSLSGVIISWNPAAARIYGYTAAEMIGQPISVIVPSDRLDELRQFWDRVLREEVIDHYETVGVREDSTQVDISIRLSPIQDTTGHVIGVSTAICPIIKHVPDNQPTLEPLTGESGRVRLLEDFIKLTSQNFRTPLSTIMVNLYLLKKSADMEKQKERLDVIEQEVDCLTKLLDDLVLLAKFDTGVEFKFRPLDINKLLLDVNTQVDSWVERKQLALLLDLDGTLPLVQADEAQLNQALTILIEHTLHDAPDRAIVAIRGYAQDDDLVIEARVPDSSAAQDQFHERSNSGSMTSDYINIYLVVAQKIIEAHRGRIEMRNDKDHRSFFRVFLPVR